MIQNKRVIIVAHFLLYGAAHALTDYFIGKNIQGLSRILLPLASQRNVYVSEYKRNRKDLLKLKEKNTLSRRINLGPLDYVIDMFQTIVFVISKEKFDTYIGFDALNCLSGLLLKKLGKVSKVVFYSIDFVPIRFSNKLLNSLYHEIEIYCVKYADQVWNVSPRIAQGREKFLHLSASRYHQQVVPVGVWNNQIKKRSLGQIKQHQVLFMGHVLEKQGVQEVIACLPSVIKALPDFHFLIVGGGEYLTNLQKQVKDFSLEEYVTFTGWINDRKKIDEMMSESAVAIATYKPEKKQLYNFTYYADPTKLKDYLSAGLPIILTDISYNAQEIAIKKCGILVQYDKNEIAKAILTLLKNKEVLGEYRKNALSYAKEFDWKIIFKTVSI